MYTLKIMHNYFKAFSLISFLQSSKFPKAGVAFSQPRSENLSRFPVEKVDHFLSKHAQVQQWYH